MLLKLTLPVSTFLKKVTFRKFKNKTHIMFLLGSADLSFSEGRV